MWSKRTLWWAIGGGVLALGLGVWFVAANLPRWLNAPAGGTTPTENATPADRKIRAQLFYVSPDGSELIPSSRDVPYGATTAEQVRALVEAQIQPPPPGYFSAIPPGTTLRTVFLAAHGEAYLDFGPEIVANNIGGSIDEALAVFAIVNAVTVNLSGSVNAVQILVNGKEVDTLAGHIDLRRPLIRSLAWVRKGQ
jgi:Sporulation and spore germination